MNIEKNEFKAMIWDKDKNLNGKRVIENAKNIEEAMKLLEEKYGKGNVFDLNNEKDANSSR